MWLVRHVVQRVRSRPATLGTAAALTAAVTLGLPTGVINNPWFDRKVPVRGFEILVLVSLSVISGFFAATYARPTDPDHRLGRTGAVTGILGWFAVSCPLCNPFVVALLGTSGATGLFARLQPALGALAVVLAATALGLRLHAIRHGSCRVPASGRATQNDEVETQAASLSYSRAGAAGRSVHGGAVPSKPVVQGPVGRVVQADRKFP